ncbi:hypothetical protein ACAW63_06255 [Pseudomonas sp. QE6]|uniref:hypothetical protein n=1 Tax=Pseudomonas sp. QE6 TaxID=3242491 RepID=UPI003528AF4E
MTDKKKADQQVGPKDMRPHDASWNVQHARQQGPINAFDAIRPPCLEKASLLLLVLHLALLIGLGVLQWTS